MFVYERKNRRNVRIKSDKFLCWANTEYVLDCHKKYSCGVLSILYKLNGEIY